MVAWMNEWMIGNMAGLTDEWKEEKGNYMLTYEWMDGKRKEGTETNEQMEAQLDEWISEYMYACVYKLTNGRNTERKDGRMNE